MKDCCAMDMPVEYGIRMTKDGEDKLVNPTYYKSLVGCLRYGVFFVSVIVIGLEVMMIATVLLDMYFILIILHSLGL
ncbi:hypothetical protein ZIOFF_050284 [Zingiber officinale]|uniref:Uncharacterized protein n=1 Tax=Zingiber officinale TaxID=94328 RepID=A0A8J5FRE2_ZINOF|nr:hypothetical protein ZIOFF_050284 [Zingiber officinale]